MSIRNLDAIFRPNTIALIGASIRPNSVGLVMTKNLLAGGFVGPVLLVNPKYQDIAGSKVYPDIASLPVVPDVALICTPPQTVPSLIAELGSRGTKGAIVVTAGFQELNTNEGRALEQAMLDAARPHVLRIIGPNCLGVLSSAAGLNASFAPGNIRKGGVAFVAQSGALVTTMLDWASSRGIGFSHLVSLGDMADVDFGDMLDYLAADAQTSAILLYIESVTQARKFMSAARAAARLKPVIAIRGGRTQAAATAARSHTGAMAGQDAVYDAAFRRAGIVRVDDLEELFGALETLAVPMTVTGDDLVILTNGGGVGVLATDALAGLGGRLTDLAPETLAKLDAVLPRTWSHGNPIDIIGDAPGERYAAALEALLDAPEVRSILVINCPTAIASSSDAARAVVAAKNPKRCCLLTNWLGSGAAQESRALFAQAGIPTYDTPTEAVRGFLHLVHYHHGQETILEVPDSMASGLSADVETIRKAARDGAKTTDGWLDPIVLQTILGGYGIEVPLCAQAKTAEEAAEIAAERKCPVALKIVSPDVLHKSDAGGVALDLQGADMVRKAAVDMTERIGRALPNARLQGFLVQDMVRRPSAYELILGMSVDRQFGPVLLFGHGGTAAEIIADKALALPPLNLALARELMSQTRIFRLLSGYRDHPAVALDAVALSLVHLSQLVCDLDEIAEIDINPLLADASGVIAVDARIRVEIPKTLERSSRLAIRPYPKELEKTESLAGIGSARLRPIRPDDAPALERFLMKLTPDDVRRRFFTPLHEFGSRQLARLTQIDYDREMAFVLEAPGAEATDLLSIVRLAADPDNYRAEFAITVRSDVQRRGIGRLMLTRLLDYARDRGLSEIYGDVLISNGAMLALGRKMGFSMRSIAGGADTQRLTLRIRPDASI